MENPNNKIVQRERKKERKKEKGENYVKREDICPTN